MSRQIDKLSARSVATISKPGRHSDGAGLYLVVEKTGAKRWVFLFRWKGKLKEMGLGSLTKVSLAAAREKARQARSDLGEDVNPLEARKAREPAPTFGEMANAFLKAKESEWQNEKHREQWAMTLTRYAAPIRGLPVDEIETDDVLGVLRPIWARMPETASRLRGRIERVLDASKAQGHRSGENPARWRGHLDHLLSRPKKLTRGHHAALPFDQVASFIGQLRANETVAGLALEFTILTAARTNETLGARWSEFDLGNKVWTVPADRMKSSREHRVPLPSRCIEILEKARPFAGPAGYVFPGVRNERLSQMAMQMVLRRMKVPITVHGFRSSFRDWAGERTTFPREIAEAALAHVVGDDTERAYRRGDALDKRRKLMEAWAAYCEPCAGATPPPLAITQADSRDDMRMRKFTTVELLRDLTSVTHAAAREPVAITQHRKPRFVLMAIEDFERLTVQPDVRRAFKAEEAPAALAGLIIKGLDGIIQNGSDERGA